MPKEYLVEMEVVVRQLIEVQADTEEEALGRAWRQEGKPIGKWRDDEVLTTAVKSEAVLVD